MASEREDNRALADRLRGKAAEAGQQLSQQVGKVQTVKEISAPSATPKVGQEQNATVRERHVTEGTGKDKSLAEIAKSMRQAGVTGGRAANDLAPAKQTPAVDHKQSRGRGR